MLTKGLQELARGIRHSLEEAYTYICVMKMSGRKTTKAAFDGEVAEIRRRAGRAKFPKLAKLGSAGLNQPLTFEEEFISLQKVRNCMEHRDSKWAALNRSRRLALSFRACRLSDRLAIRPTPNVAHLVLKNGIGRSSTSAPQIEHLYALRWCIST